MTMHPVNHCRCMQKGVVLLEEVENKSSDFDHAALDSALAYQKGALETCMSMLRCHNCAGCLEIAVLLTIIAGKLSLLCERIISQFLQHLQGFNMHKYAQGHWPTPTLSEDKTAPRQNLFLGDYEIDSMIEWIPLIRGLIVVQLRGLHSLLARLKVQGTNLCDSQLTKLSNVERHIKKMAARLRGNDVEL